ncbi:uncharacterized protein LOC117572505 isoform X3 [Drosophila albomicans]|uniref:Uncharacterized protein LOC117572505 isoform X3 n=1 Tax=Drosophila albomicans TaxID=7291 RepID=A0A6P8XII5_DROAB|nr:uncharacterized protein LOC117572505 isoform X3 [Drosophila albomicans]
MPSRRSGGVGTTRRKHSLGNLRRAHPASGATWNVQVVRGKMSSKCLWHACRALILGLTLMLVGAGMATLGYYADHLSMGSELRGNVTVRVKNDLKGFHLNNFSYVGPIVMGFGGFIVVASCVMTFEARDSAAKVVPARLRAGGGSCNKSTARSNQGSSASQRRGMGAQYQSTRWDQHFGVFRSSPGDAHQQLQASGVAGDQLQAHQQLQQPFDREALTAELIKFSKSLSNSTMSDSSYSGRWTARCASVASRTSSIDSRQVRVDLHSPEVMPKSILRSPKRYSCGPSATPSVEKDFRSQLSVCSEPPPPVRQLSGQSSMEPAVPEESVELIDERHSHDNDECHVSSYSEITELAHHSSSLPPKKQRPDFLPLGSSADHQQQQQQQQSSDTQKVNPATLYRSNSSRQFYRPKPGIANERDDSVFYIRSLERHASSTSGDDHMYDSLRVINERRSTLLKADSQSSLGSAERKLSSFSLKMPDITERENSIDIEDPPKTEAETLPKESTDEEKPKEETP